MNSDGSETAMLRSLSERLGIPNILEVLAIAPMRLLQPIFVNAMRQRASNKAAPELLAEYEEKSSFFGISKADIRQMHKFTGHFYEVLGSEYIPVELSPITPLGLNSILSRVSQDVTLSTIRASEVVSDPTTALALECALRRRWILADSSLINQGVHLATMGKVLRLQPFEKGRGYLQHFRLFGLCSGGRNVGQTIFATETIKEHISIWLEFVAALEATDWQFKNVEVKFSDVRVLDSLISHLGLPRDEINRHSLDEDYDLFERFDVQLPREVSHATEVTDVLLGHAGISHLKRELASLERQVVEPIRDRFPHVRCSLDLARKAGLGYYQDNCYHIFAEDSKGRRVQLADGGTVDWLRSLLVSKKERMVTSGFGCELVHNLFRLAS